MLKTKFNDSIRLVTQPNHAVAAGYMASHWGNKEFTKLGFYDNFFMSIWFKSVEA